MRALPAAVRPEPFDVDEPMVRRYVARVLALRPADWDRLVPAPPWRPAGLLVSALLAGLDAVQAAAERAQVAPAWRWRGTGPLRELAEVLERSYVAPVARATVLLGLRGILDRRVLAPQVIGRMYARMEPLVPWETLGEPRPWARPPV